MLHLDDAASYLVDDDNADVLIQVDWSPPRSRTFDPYHVYPLSPRADRLRLATTEATCVQPIHYNAQVDVDRASRVSAFGGCWPLVLVVPCSRDGSDHPPECRDDFALAPRVILWTHRDDIGTDDDPTQQNWIEWMAATFPPDVCQNFVLLPVYRANGR